MNDENPDLEEGLVAAIKDVPPADPALRDAHISAALAQGNASNLAGARSVGRRAVVTRFVAAAAAAVVLLGAGFLLGSATSGGPDGGLASSTPDASGADSTVPVKGSAGGAAVDSIVRATQVSPCDDTMGLQLLARYQSPSGWNAVYLRVTPSPALMVVTEEACAVEQEIALP